MSFVSKKLVELRELMKHLPVVGGSIQAYIVTGDDRHQSENGSAHDRRRAFISGFSGSAGTAVIMETEARLWTDGRYWTQAENQLDEGWNLMRDGLTTIPSIGKYLAKNLPSGSKVGVDPSLISYRLWRTISAELSSNDCELYSVRVNLVDRIWSDQPAQLHNQCTTLDQKFCGETIESKVEKIRQQMKDRDVYAMIVTSLDEIPCAWGFKFEINFR